MGTPVQRLIVSACFFVGTAPPALAGSIEQAVMTGQPQMQVSNGSVVGCGIRILGVALSPASTHYDAVDVSFNLYAQGLALVKGGSVRVPTRSDGQPPAPEPITGFWLKAPGNDATRPNAAGVERSDTPGFLIYGTGVESVGLLFSAVFAGEPIMVSVRRTGEDIDRIYSGVVKMTEVESKQVADCLDELVVRMKKSSSQAGATK